MFRRHVSRQLAAHIHGELASRKAQRVELHLARCERCRAEREQVRFGTALLDHLPAAQAPDSIWISIQAALSQYRPRQPQSLYRRRLAFAALAVLLVGGAMYWSMAQRPETRWEVVKI